jgi:Ca2+-binding RTX toxin-like protein
MRQASLRVRFAGGLAAVVAGAGLPAPASAATVDLSGPANTRLTYTAGSHERNRLRISSSDPKGDVVQVSDPGATVTPGNGCQQTAPGTIECSNRRAIRSFTVNLLDLSDRGDVILNDTRPAIVVNGDADDDVIRVRGGDTAAVNGGAGNDRATTQLNTGTLLGGVGDDRLDAGFGDGDVIKGEAGADFLIDRGGAGDKAFGGSGGDQITSFDGKADLVSCGAGRDRAKTSALDTRISCEFPLVTSIP